MDSKKTRRIILLFLLIGVFIGVFAKNYPTLNGYTGSLIKEFNAREKGPEIIQVSSNLSKKEIQTVNKSAASAVRIISRDQSGMVAASTGTVFTHDDIFYIITVAHGIVGDCSTTIVWSGKSNFTPCLDIIAIDREADYSIMVIDKPIGVEAVELTSVLPRRKQWSKSVSLQNKIFYTGFPNSVGPLTISGRVVGLSDINYIFVHSYAWSGSSGSGVFSSDGKFIGVVMAVDVGQTIYGVDVLEDMVVVLPSSRIDWSSILL
jgi:hypothetical protein